MQQSTSSGEVAAPGELGAWCTDSGAGVTWLRLGPERRAENAAELDALLADLSRVGDGASRPAWLGMISYDAARVFEPAMEDSSLAASVSRRAREDRGWPLAIFRPVLGIVDAPGADESFHVGAVRSDSGEESYVEGVRRALAYIHAGDVYQVNLAHRLVAPFAGSARAFFVALAQNARPWHGAFLESSCGTIASASPELFLAYDASDRTLRTRPMKGTRPTSQEAHQDLEVSEKDRAELAMIVDLMRNDLGRICEIGSVCVEVAREIESHRSGVLQATATVRGRLSRGLGFADVIRRTFPPGSVTGAPKVRAMQIIDELEPVRRGPYCGSMVLLRADGSAELSVAIRTALIGPENDADRRLDYSVGAGIVADSCPQTEWQETLAKSSALRAACAGSAAARS